LERRGKFEDSCSPFCQVLFVGLVSDVHTGERVASGTPPELLCRCAHVCVCVRARMRARACPPSPVRPAALACRTRTALQLNLKLALTAAASLWQSPASPGSGGSAPATRDQDEQHASAAGRLAAVARSGTRQTRVGLCRPAAWTAPAPTGLRPAAARRRPGPGRAPGRAP
jgi:hypothetical protein